MLAALFLIGAFGQFFLVGLSSFDDGEGWSDHASLGHTLGMLTWGMWFPAVLGRAGVRLIGATVALFLLFFAQHAFIDADSTTMQAFHPLNGSVMLVLSFWITQRALARRTAEMALPLPQDGAAMAEGLQRSTP